jgi:hypothetical protein
VLVRLACGERIEASPLREVTVLRYFEEIVVED